MKQGRVFLVGAGPGDVQLITVKGLEAIRRAEVILYDRLVNPKLLEFAPSDCELIYCGKLPDRHILRQEMINALLVEKALEGKTVVRLKGGDPSVFGRVGEEAEALAEHHLPFEIVPGITSGIAASAYAGIPVTHREYGGSFAVVTAHDKSKDGKPTIDWAALNGIDTIAFYMGIANLAYLSENLIKHGKSPNKPTILIQWGTYGRQKTLEGTLATIADQAARAQFKNPAITLVGDVVSIREKISWFEKKPLFGRQILLARTGIGESNMAKELREQGADVIEFPKWKAERKTMTTELIGKISSYSRMLFTSPESIDFFFTGLLEQGIDIRAIKADFYVLSSKSAKALNTRGLLVKRAEEMVQEGQLLIVGDQFLKENELAYTIQYGSFDLYITHDKQLDEKFVPLFHRMVEEAELDSIILPSSASVTQLLKGLDFVGLEAKKFLGNLQVICMGAETKRTAEQFGLRTDGMPETPTTKALTAFLQNHSAKKKAYSNV